MDSPFFSLLEAAKEYITQTYGYQVVDIEHLPPAQQQVYFSRAGEYAFHQASWCLLNEILLGIYGEKIEEKVAALFHELGHFLMVDAYHPSTVCYHEKQQRGWQFREPPRRCGKYSFCRESAHELSFPIYERLCWVEGLNVARAVFGYQPSRAVRYYAYCCVCSHRQESSGSVYKVARVLRHRKIRTLQRRWER
jgi:hypothetical protein